MTDLDTQREQLAAAFDRSLDPLAEIASELEALDLDPFDLFIAFDLESRDVTPGTIKGYRRVFDEWIKHMTEEGRHPACPNEAHVKSYIQKQVAKGNASSTINYKLVHLRGRTNTGSATPRSPIRRITTQSSLPWIPLRSPHRT